jgi:hypothetical protein
MDNLWLPKLDAQMNIWSERLQKDVGLSKDKSLRVATNIAI